MIDPEKFLCSAENKRVNLENFRRSTEFYRNLSYTENKVIYSISYCTYSSCLLLLFVQVLVSTLSLYAFLVVFLFHVILVACSPTFFRGFMG